MWVGIDGIIFGFVSLPDLGYQTEATRLRLPDLGYQTEATRLRLPDLGYQT